MTDTTRDLIQRMAGELDLYRQMVLDDRTSTHPLADEARAFLSQPEPEGPTEEELLELMPETMRNEFAAVSDLYSTATGDQVKPGLFRVVLNTVALEYARAVLARWGSALPTPQP